MYKAGNVRKSRKKVVWRRNKKGFRLPTEAEWEYAARGEEGREYPCGSEIDKTKAVFKSRCAAAVNDPRNIKGATPEGIRGLAGNVFEWVWDKWAGRYDPNKFNNPIGPRGNIALTDSDIRVCRGGSFWFAFPAYLRGASRDCRGPMYRNSNLGFRVVEDL